MMKMFQLGSVMALALAVMACEGPIGEPGEGGEVGEPGDPGAPGSDGVDGVDGQPGSEGVDGQPGADGSDGAPGQDGMDGAPGAAGLGLSKSTIYTNINLMQVPAGANFENFLPCDDENDVLMSGSCTRNHGTVLFTSMGHLDQDSTTLASRFSCVGYNPNAVSASFWLQAHCVSVP